MIPELTEDGEHLAGTDSAPMEAIEDYLYELGGTTAPENNDPTNGGSSDPSGGDSGGGSDSSGGSGDDSGGGMSGSDLVAFDEYLDQAALSIWASGQQAGDQGSGSGSVGISPAVLIGGAGLVGVAVVMGGDD